MLTSASAGSVTRLAITWICLMVSPLYWWDWCGVVSGEISDFIRTNGMFVMLPAGVCSPADLTVCHLDPACTATLCRLLFRVNGKS